MANSVVDDDDDDDKLLIETNGTELERLDKI
jgi:hypothetical protein